MNIGVYEELYFQLYYKQALIFLSDAPTLIVQYSENEYAKQVKHIEDGIPIFEGRNMVYMVILA